MKLKFGYYEEGIFVYDTDPSVYLRSKPLFEIINNELILFKYVNIITNSDVDKEGKLIIVGIDEV